MGLALRIVDTPPINRIALKILKDRAFKPYQLPLEEALERQTEVLKEKFRRMENTEIGKKIGINSRAKLEELPITDYELYEPFFNNPSPSAFMYSVEEYMRVRTSGTAGREKWFMIPKRKIRNLWQTGLSGVVAIFHDGEKVNLECGCNFYVNVAPRPFIGGSVLSLGGGKTPFFNLVPNFNLSYKEKVQYFINNYEKINGAVLLASSLISEIIPAIRKPIKLKGLAILDTPIGEIYRDEITRFAGTIPKAGYGSTETGFCAVPSVQHPLGFFFDWRRGIAQFVPVKRERAEELISIDEVTVGEIYKLVYTDLESELTKYDTKDSFKCIAKGDDVLGIESPIFKFHARMEKTISLQNFTRISEEELLTVFRNAMVPFIDFTARVEVERGMEYLAIYIELTGDRTAADLQETIHKELYKEDADYRGLVDFFGYMPVKVHVVPRGTFMRYLQEKGVTIPKVARVNMDDKDFKKLLNQ